MGDNHKNNNKKTLKRYKGKNVNPFSGAVQMGQYASRMIKDIAFGNFNYEKDYMMFQNTDFLNAAIHEAEQKVIEQQIYNTALNYTYANSNDATVFRLMNKHKKALDGWMLVYTMLCGILQSGDLGLLVGLMNRLPDYKHVL